MTLLSFRHDVRVEPAADGVRLSGPWGALAIRTTDEEVRAGLRRLAGPPLPLGELPERLARLTGRLGYLLARSIHVDGRELARVEAVAREADYTPAPVPAEASVQLAKFTLLRAYEGHLVVESPLVKQRMALLDPAARSMVAALGAPVRVADLPPSGLSDQAVAELLAHLVGAGFAEVTEEEHPVLRQWDFHDLLFHARSRFGRHDEPFGGIFPYVGEIEPQPAVKEPPQGPSVELHRPELDELLERDPVLTTVLEGRASVRQSGEQPMTVEQLGEFLYRVARVRSQFGPVPESMPYEATSRPYPCGGSAYELELYVTVRRCAGLAEGVYYYDPVGHRLVLVNDDEEDRAALLRMAYMATARSAVPDVLFTMTSRFQRLSWKYRGIAYAVTLKHAGVLYQTMYLVATAMGLAPCGLGSGDADLVSRVMGLDYLRESSVGEFMLGSLPADGPQAHRPEGWRRVNDAEWAEVSRDALRALR
ncbi:SagB family peptide dehydrogenase [Nonomuraea sp. NPDC000554]|uniref:SagB/ThcOx family dehydrogenase n=1 Tax=Nonomuraea sp. NPDC000554 TaxID=3154259 RepID=UPI00332803EE